jgi:putative ABC transport system permease protein
VPVAVNAIADATAGNATTAGVLALGPGALAAAEPAISGTAWTGWHERDGLRVALLGATVAEALGIERVDPGQVVRVDGIPFALAGIVHQAAREPALLRAVLVPAGAAARTWPGRASEAPHVLVRVEPGAAAVVAGQAALALRPDAPELLGAVAPPDPATLRHRVEAEVEGLLLVVGSVSLAVGTVGIGTSTMVSVLERRRELALRRALGARPSHLVRHVLTDTALLGLASAVIGTVAAVAVTLGVAAARGWSPVIDPRVLIAGPLLGSAIGAVAGVPAARRAARAEPAEAIRA